MAYMKLLRVNAWSYPQIRGKLQKELRTTVRVHSLRITADIRKSFRQPKTGRAYYYRGRRIIASAPGEAPAIRSGRLYKNVNPIVSKSGLQARIDPKTQGVFYAAWLEEGTTRMAARPYITPAFARRRQAFLNEVRMKLAKSLGQG
jgi:hypothetical protein